MTALLAVTVLLAGDATLDRGFRELYYLNFTGARKIFSEYQKEQPADPMGPTAEAASYLFEQFERHGILTTEFFLDDDLILGGIRGTADPRALATFHATADRARQLAQRTLRSAPNDPNALLAMVITSGMRADAASMIEKRQLESLKLIKEARENGAKLLAGAPNMKDGYMALGAASYVIGCLPLYKRVLLRFGGIQGDRQRGMEELAIAAREGHYLRAYAKVMLALACLRENQPARARQLINELAAEFPKSTLFERERAKIDRITDSKGKALN